MDRGRHRDLGRGWGQREKFSLIPANKESGQRQAWDGDSRRGWGYRGRNSLIQANKEKWTDAGMGRGLGEGLWIEGRNL